MWSFVLALITTFTWGIASVFVIPLSTQDVHPFLIESVYGFVTVVVNLLSLNIEALRTQHSLKEYWIPLQSLPLSGALAGYCICFVTGTLCYLYAAQVQDISVPILTAITSCYPLITMIVAWTIYSHAGETNFKCAICGILLIVTGVILLGWSQRPKYAISPSSSKVEEPH